MLKIGISPT